MSGQLSNGPDSFTRATRSALGSTDVQRIWSDSLRLFPPPQKIIGWKRLILGERLNYTEE